MTTGERIKAARKKKNVPQSWLANEIGTSSQVISQYERGVRNPKYETLLRIADALDVTPEFLLNGQGGEIKELDWDSIIDILRECGYECVGSWDEWTSGELRIWPADIAEEDIWENSVKISFADLAEMIENIQRDFERKKIRYIASRIKLEFFDKLDSENEG